MCVCVLGGQKKALHPLELELQVFGSCPVGAGNWMSSIHSTAISPENKIVKLALGHA